MGKVTPHAVSQQSTSPLVPVDSSWRPGLWVIGKVLSSRHGLMIISVVSLLPPLGPPSSPHLISEVVCHCSALYLDSFSVSLPVMHTQIQPTVDPRALCPHPPVSGAVIHTRLGVSFLYPSLTSHVAGTLLSCKKFSIASHRA